MKKFITKFLLFNFILVLFFLIGLLLPSTPRVSNSLLFAKNQKDSLLRISESPRIIFIGGSNLSFGLNSQMIKDALGLNPINTAVHANIGLIFMLDAALDDIKAGDLVVVAPEYDQFFGQAAYGGEELLRTILDVSPSSIRLLRASEFANIYKLLPKYSFSKFEPAEYFNTNESTIYTVDAFNQFGDAYAHWRLGKQKFNPFNPSASSYNQNVIDELCKFKNKLEKKKAKLYITFPAFQDISFENYKDQISQIYLELKKRNLPLLGSPVRYKIADSLMFNTPYHLTKAGVDYRTRLLIEDLKRVREVESLPSNNIASVNGSLHFKNNR